jgi:hypothetical protein
VTNAKIVHVQVVFKMNSILDNYKWRIRDEYLYRKKENRTGGFYHFDDKISKMNMNELEKEITKLKGDS